MFNGRHITLPRHILMRYAGRVQVHEPRSHGDYAATALGARAAVVRPVVITNSKVREPLMFTMDV